MKGSRLHHPRARSGAGFEADIVSSKVSPEVVLLLVQAAHPGALAGLLAQLKHAEPLSHTVLLGQAATGFFGWLVIHWLNNNLETPSTAEAPVMVVMMLVLERLRSEKAMPSVVSALGIAERATAGA